MMSLYINFSLARRMRWRGAGETRLRPIRKPAVRQRSRHTVTRLRFTVRTYRPMPDPTFFFPIEVYYICWEVG